MTEPGDAQDARSILGAACGLRAAPSLSHPTKEELPEFDCSSCIAEMEAVEGQEMQPRSIAVRFILRYCPRSPLGLGKGLGPLEL